MDEMTKCYAEALEVSNLVNQDISAGPVTAEEILAFKEGFESAWHYKEAITAVKDDLIKVLRDQLDEFRQDYVKKYKEPRVFCSTDVFHITGRGYVYALKMPDPPIYKGEKIIMNGKAGECIGIESHAVEWGEKVGQPVGILFKAIS